MTITFGIMVLLMVSVSMVSSDKPHEDQLIRIEPGSFRVNKAFIAGSALIIGVLAGLYTALW
jgi:solute:Na+ symporter, SSS family